MVPLRLAASTAGVWRQWLLLAALLGLGWIESWFLDFFLEFWQAVLHDVESRCPYWESFALTLLVILAIGVLLDRRLGLALDHVLTNGILLDRDLGKRGCGREGDLVLRAYLSSEPSCPAYLCNLSWISFEPGCHFVEILKLSRLLWCWRKWTHLSRGK
jgi:hypothetical protein